MAKATFTIEQDGQVMMIVEESGPRSIVSRESIGVLYLPKIPGVDPSELQGQISQLLQAAFGAGEQTRAGEIRRLL